MRHQFHMDGLHCASCADKIEREVRVIPGVLSAVYSLSTEKMLVVSEREADALRSEIQSIADRIEPGVSVLPSGVASNETHTRGWGADEWQLIVGLVLFGVGFLLPSGTIWRTGAFLTSWVVAGGSVLLAAVRSARNGQWFDENTLMTIATLGAVVIGETPEAAAVMLFYRVGEWFQDGAVDRSRRSIRSLLAVRPDTARLLEGDAETIVSPESVAVGARIRVRPGERVPLDGTVTEGTAWMDTSALTGESVPRRASEGDSVPAGSLCTDGVLTLVVDRPFADSTVARMLSLIEEAGARKAPTEQFITKFARYYTPAVVLAAALLALIPPLVLSQPFSVWVYRALIFLVVSCPCALVISIPLGFFGGIGAASRRGILIKGGNYLEALAHTDAVIFDKTGTLTKGNFTVTHQVPADGFEGDLLAIAATAEAHSNHPIAAAIREAAGHTEAAADVREVAGRGVEANVDGQIVRAGSAAWLEEIGVRVPPVENAGTVVHLSQGGTYIGHLVIADEMRPDAEKAVSDLHAMGVSRVAMLTGDASAVAARIGDALGIDEVHSELLPQDKVALAEEMLAHRKQGETLVFVGDGINDAPVLARADVGIAMGAIGSDAAIEAADAVIMTDEPSRVAEAIGIARATRRIVFQNIVFALGIKGIVLLLSALGYATMWAAVFADVGVALLAVLNSMRLLPSRTTESS